MATATATKMLQINRRTRPWWTLVGACTGLFVLMLDSTVVVLALSAIHRELDATLASLQWVVNGYLLVIAVLVITASRLGDIFGRRRVFMIGVALFAAGSVLSAVAGSDIALVVGRIVQGAGGAAMLGLSLALVADAFPANRQARVLGIWAAVSAIALAIGPLVGGALIAVDWRLIFWVNLPICAFGLAVMGIGGLESRDETATQRVDYPGLLALTVGLTAVVFALIESDSWGLGSPATLGLAAAGVLALVGFYAIEHRVGDPIVQFSLFRNGPYFGATAAAFGIISAYWTVMFYEPQYLQDVLGHTALASGLMVLPITAPMVVISPQAARLTARFGPRKLMTFGMLLGTVGVFVLTRITDTSGYALLLPGFLLLGISIGLVYAPMSVAAMAAMPRSKAGIAAGVLAMDRVLAGAIGLAATGAVFQALQSDKLEQLHGSSHAADHAFVYGIQNSFWVLVALLVIATVLTWLFVRPQARTGKDRAVAGTPPAMQLQHHQHHRRFHL